MEITRDVIYDRFNQGHVVAGISKDAQTQFLGMAKVIAAEHIRGYKPRDLYAENMRNGNVKVEVSPSLMFNPHAEVVYCCQCHMNIAKIGHTASCPTRHENESLNRDDGMTWLDWLLIGAAIVLLATGLIAEGWK